MNATFKTVMLWMSLLVVVFLAWHFAQFQKKETPVKFSEFMAQVEAGQVAGRHHHRQRDQGPHGEPRGVPDLRPARATTS